MPAPHKNNDDKTNRATEAAHTARSVTDEAADAGQHAARAGAEITRSNAETAQQIMQSGLNMASEAAERSMDQFARVFGFSDKQAEKAAQESSRNIEAMAECNTVLAHGFQDISREWASLAQKRFERNLDGFQALLRCRTPQDFIAVQSKLMRDNLELLVDNSRRLAEMSVKVADAAAQKIMAPAEETAKRVRRAA